MGKNRGKKGGKKPRHPVADAKLQPSQGAKKAPRRTQTPSDLADTVVWQVQRLDDFPVPWAKANWTDLVARMRYLEQLGWRGISMRQGQRHTDHDIPVDKLSIESKRRLMTLKLDDTDSLLSIHVSGCVRAWAVRVGDSGIARLLWWDPKHEVYPTTKRNT